MAYNNYKYTNNARSTLASPIWASDTTIILASWTWWIFPTTFPFYATVEQFDSADTSELKPVVKREIVTVSNRSWDVLTVTRGTQACPPDDATYTQGTTQFSFLSGDYLEARYTNDDILDIKRHIDEDTMTLDWANEMWWDIIPDTNNAYDLWESWTPKRFKDWHFAWDVTADAFFWDWSWLTWVSWTEKSFTLSENMTAWEVARLIGNWEIEKALPNVEEVFNTADTRYITYCYDSLNDKVVISYQDRWNSDYWTSIVWTVNWSKITFWSEVVFNPVDTDYISCTFDTLNDKAVIGYQDVWNSSFWTWIVGTVSGTSISFWWETVFNSASTPIISCTFDTLNDKAVIGYQDIWNSNYWTAVVGTVSGTNISFWWETVFNSASTFYISCTFDTLNDKAVIGYQDIWNSNYWTAVVGTVSGTNISFWW